MYKKLGMCILLLFLPACTTDPIPEEEFEAPTSDFPLLGTVPDRPTLPESKLIKKHQKQLQSEHDQALEKEKDLKKFIKS